ncbi:hypothetical protein ElyMa_002624000 [Elysia marginata]|uniref:Ig-like domain-containing protein n=1 Tax=Elysia marginata TaxID=1093978 RepID=A0AAV4H5X1_9GAST|nr:hypothetical protein ElyMa_002624000 [Elysia marginata]
MVQSLPRRNLHNTLKNKKPQSNENNSTHCPHWNNRLQPEQDRKHRNETKLKSRLRLGSRSSIHPSAERTPLNVTCTADGVGDQYTNVTSLTISRVLEGYGPENEEMIAVFYPDSTGDDEKHVPQGRNWEIHFINETSNNLETTTARTGPRIKWTIQDTQQADAGMYRCTVKYDNGTNESFRQERLRLTAVSGNLLLQVEPTSHNHRYIEGDLVVLSCRLVNEQMSISTVCSHVKSTSNLIESKITGYLRRRLESERLRSGWTWKEKD